jgi:hypothetical protein
VIELALGALLGGALTALFHRVFARPARRALPAPARPPQDRGEAVRRVLKHLQRRSVAELREGEAAVIVGIIHEVPGVARVRSPISHTECLGFHLDIRRVDFDPPVWTFVQLYEHALMVDVDIRDDSGAIRVDARGLELAITDAPIARWSPPLPPALLALVPPQFHHAPITVEEGLLHAGARILVCGVVERSLAPTDYRDGASAFVLRASSTFPLVASSDADLLTPGARPIAPEELHRTKAP